MNRNLTNVLRFFLDELLPPIIRDNKYVMYPLFWIWYKGKHVKKRMEFKSAIATLTEESYNEFYSITDSLSHDRPTDLNRESIAHIIKNIGTDKNVKVLDMGCGRGYFLNLLNEQGYTNLHGCDLLPNVELNNASYTSADIENLPFEDNEFDVVVCSHTIEHLRNVEPSMKELKRITKSKLIITVPCQRYYRYTFDLHIHFFPEKYFLLNTVQIENNTCDKIKGDWVLVGTLD